MIVEVKYRYKLNHELKQTLKSMEPEFGFNGLGEVVFRRTYSRDNEDWADVVIRVIEGVITIRKNHYYKNGIEWNEKEWDSTAEKMALSMFKMEWLPPGRGLWMMGTPFVYERGAMALYNCSATDSEKDFVKAAHWGMDCLMNGVGVGFNTNWKGKVSFPNKSEIRKVVIEDSREGWIDSVATLMRSFVADPETGRPEQEWFPEFDYSKVRKQGEKIKGFGGTASGPKPLQDLHERIERYFMDFLSDNPDYTHSRLVADVFNAIGACVVAGNVRRSAEICLGSADDTQFMNLKNYEKHPERMEIGWLSNNSVLLKDTPTNEVLKEMAQRISDNGEPGMLNLANSQRYGRMGEDREDKTAILTNPCVTGDTWVMTTEGSFQVKDLVDKPHDVLVHGKPYKSLSGFFSTGVKDVYHLKTKEGFNIKLTDNHKLKTSCGKWVEVKDLQVNDTLSLHNHREFDFTIVQEDWKMGWLLGTLFGDGTFDYKQKRVIWDFWGNDQCDMISRVEEYLIELGLRDENQKSPTENNSGTHTRITSSQFECFTEYIKKGKVLTDNIESSSLSLQSGFLQGWFDTDGCVCVNNKKGSSIRLSSVSKNELKRALRMLLRQGIRGRIYENRENEGYRQLPDGKGGVKLYWCKSWDELVVSRDSIFQYHSRIGFSHENKRRKLQLIIDGMKRKPYQSKWSVEITSIEPVGQEEVYDCVVEDVHMFDAQGFVSHNCGEISLADKETCNLSEIFPTRCYGPEEFFNAIRYATLYSSTVALLPTHRRETNNIIMKNRRIGVSISGIAQWASGFNKEGWSKNMNYSEISKYLDSGYKIVRSENKRLARDAGVPESIRVTTIKPSGTISLLAGVTPGIHFPVSRYAIRRIRVGTQSPIIDALLNSNVPNEDDQFSANTKVFEFTIDHGPVRPCEEVSPWEQFALIRMVQKYWADNSVSATVYFDKESCKPEEIQKMLDLYIPELKSVSMLPHSGHGYAQAPYEPLTEEEYNKRVEETKIDFSNTKGNVPSGSVYCTGDNCVRV